jgi:hypothetical protein
MRGAPVLRRATCVAERYSDDLGFVLYCGLSAFRSAADIKRMVCMWKSDAEVRVASLEHGGIKATLAIRFERWPWGTTWAYSVDAAYAGDHSASRSGAASSESHAKELATAAARELLGMPQIPCAPGRPI